MPRWDPDARERLVRAALDLFVEQGFDETTVIQIAERAGLTRSTFFRYFPDKRDVLSAGQEVLAALLVDGIARASSSASPLEAVRSGLERAGTVFTDEKRELGPVVEAVTSGNEELRARATQKRTGLAAAMTTALQLRGVAEPGASVAGDLGVLAFTRAHAEWSAPDNQASFVEIVSRTLDDLVAAVSTL